MYVVVDRGVVGIHSEPEEPRAYHLGRRGQRIDGGWGEGGMLGGKGEEHRFNSPFKGTLCSVRNLNVHII